MSVGLVIFDRHCKCVCRDYHNSFTIAVLDSNRIFLNVKFINAYGRCFLSKIRRCGNSGFLSYKRHLFLMMSYTLATRH